ncbi:hypothetical protein [Acinetobacter sp.]|uniref:hypothetical protein n=1 Tax=Acinetobacter sp. TaxID=472 RepID=UPI0038908711
MKDYLQKNITMLSAITGVAFVVIFVLLVLLFSARELQQKTLDRVDQMVTSQADLPGKKNQISDRSKYEIQTLFKDNPYVVGAYTAKIHYEKTENPIIFIYAKNTIINKLYTNYDEIQRSGKGFSSKELNGRSDQSLRNSEEAKTGLIRCDELSSTNIGKLAPGIDKVVKGVCRATIPPFDENVNLGVVVMLNIPPNINSNEIQEIRRILLQLQIDIYNRDFQGRETWAHL